MSATRLQIDAVKKTSLMKQNMREVAELLNESPPNESKARLRAEALIHDDHTIEAYEIIKAECELLAERVSMIDHYEECPADLLGCVSDVMFAAPRLGISEMTSVRRQFRKKYGRAFKNRAMANEGGVLNPKVVSNLALQPPSTATVNLYMTKICEQHEVDWTPTVIELSQRHVVVAAEATPTIPVTTGLQQTDTDIVEGRSRNLTSLDVLPPPPPVAPGHYQPKNNNGNDTSSVSSDTSRDNNNDNNGAGDNDGGGGGSLPVAMAYNATETYSPAGNKDTSMFDVKQNNHVSCY